MPNESATGTKTKPTPRASKAATPRTVTRVLTAEEKAAAKEAKIAAKKAEKEKER